MKKIYFLLLGLFVFLNTANAQDWINSSFINSDDVVDISDISIDENKNSYLLGKYRGTISFNGSDYTSTPAKYDIFLAKYDSDKQPLWIVTIGSNDNDIPGMAITNSNGNIIITGSYRSIIKFTATDSLISEGITDNFIAEYSTSGNLLQFRNIGKGSNVQLVKSLDQDVNSNYILSGTFRDKIIVESDTLYGRTTIYENFLLRLKEDLSKDTLIEINGNNNRNVINSVKVTPDGYYFSGKYRDSLYFDIDTLYNSSGVDNIFFYKTDFDFKGDTIREIIGNGDDNIGTFANDNYGNVYTAGYFQGDSIIFNANTVLYNKGGLDIFIAKYNKSGKLIWARNYGGIGDDWVSGIALNQNVLYVTGYFSDTIIFKEDTLRTSGAGDRDIFIGTFDLNGNMLIAKSIDGSDGNDDSGFSIELFNDNAIIGGYFQSAAITIGTNTHINTTPGEKDVFIAEFEPNLLLTFTEISEIQCNGQTNGLLTVTPYFGDAPYTYSWSHNDLLSDSTAVNLGAGTYTVTVTDASLHTQEITYTLVEPDIIMFNPLITNIATCYDSEEGAIDLNMTGGTGNFSYQWQGSDGGYGIVLNQEDQSNLTIGTYTVNVVDANSCVADTTIFLTGPSAMTFSNSVVTDSSNLNPGAIDLVTQGGTGTLFTYNWDFPTGGTATTEDISNLHTGNYSVTVIDENSCEFDTIFNVANVDAFYVFIETYKDACLGTTNGKATVSYYSPDNHTNITYQWDSNAGSQNTATATNLAPGKYYKVTVTDVDSDPDEVRVDSVYIDELTYDFAGSLSGTSILDCYGDNNGYIDLSITTAGTKPYSYSWSTGSTLQDAVNLGIGTYSVTVTDAYDCIFEITDYSIIQPVQLLASASIVQNPTCNGDFDGEVTANGTGGTLPYSYQWDDPGFQNTKNADGLDAGYYSVTLSDANSCEAKSGIQMIQPDEINAWKTVSNISCNAAGDGSVTLTVTGGTSPYTYIWSTVNGSGLVVTDKDQTELLAGKYYFTITDSHDCLYEDSIEIIEPDEIAITSETTTDATNSSSLDGTVVVEASGGTAPLSFTLQPGGETNSTGIFNNLNPGDYTVEVSDFNDCGPVISSTLTVGAINSISGVFSGGKILLYPNPTSGMLNLKIESTKNIDYSLQIINISGQVMYTNTFNTSVEETQTLNLSEFAKGFYFVKIFNGKGSYQEKILVQ